MNILIQHLLTDLAQGQHLLHPHSPLLPRHCPQTTGSIAFDGRQSKLIITDYTFGAKGSLLFTASIFLASRIGERDVFFLFGDADQSHEFALTLTGAGTRSYSSRLQFLNFP